MGARGSGPPGHDYGEKANTRQDCANPTLVVGLLGKAVVRTACGFSHTLALTANGRYTRSSTNARPRRESAGSEGKHCTWLL